MANRMNEFEQRKTDIAWGKLKSRLQDDNLLKDNQPKRFAGGHIKVVTIGIGLAAMIAVIFLITFSSIFDKGHENKIAFLNQVNDQESSLVTTLSDGSIVYLGKNGSIKYPDKFISKSRNVSLNGDAFFEVAKNREKPFIITTKDVIIEVLGTSFSITRNENTPFMLNVRTGKVKVTDRKSNQIVYVEKGHGVSLLSGHLKSFLSSDNPIDNFVKDFRFKDQSLKSIVDVLNSISTDDKIELSNDISSRKLTVAFSGENINQMAKLIGLALNLDVQKKNGIIYMKER